jgi:integrase
MSKLTKKLIDGLEPEDRDYIVWDDKVSGFGVKVTPAGRKVYLLKYRSDDGRQRKPTIGVHGNITCEEAREIAAGWHLGKSQGKDTAKIRQELRGSPSMAELCDSFIKRHVEIHKKPGGVWLDKFYIRAYIKPRLGALKAASVTKQDVQKFHGALRDTPAQANRMLATLSKMFSLAEDWEIRPRHSNPVEGIQKYKETPRERYLTESELGALGDVLNEMERDGLEAPHFISLVRLLLLTGARLREIMHAKWEWVNKETAMLVLPDSKTGRKIIHLSPTAMEVLDAIERVRGNPYIIVGQKEGQPLINAKKPWRRIKEMVTVRLLQEDSDYAEIIIRLRKKSGGDPSYGDVCREAKKGGLIASDGDRPIGITDVRLHDLRHTYASICVGQGMSLQMVAKLLGHAQVSTSERYAHLANDPVKSAAAQAGKSLSGLIGKKKGETL